MKCPYCVYWITRVQSVGVKLGNILFSLANGAWRSRSRVDSDKWQQTGFFTFLSHGGAFKNCEQSHYLSSALIAVCFTGPLICMRLLCHLLIVFASDTAADRSRFTYQRRIHRGWGTRRPADCLPRLILSSGASTALSQVSQLLARQFTLVACSLPARQVLRSEETHT